MAAFLLGAAHTGVQTLEPPPVIFMWEDLECVRNAGFQNSSQEKSSLQRRLERSAEREERVVTQSPIKDLCSAEHRTSGCVH